MVGLGGSRLFLTNLRDPTEEVGNKHMPPFFLGKNPAENQPLPPLENGKSSTHKCVGKGYVMSS